MHGYKIILIGDTYVGKTSILIRFLNNTFSDNLKPTIGCDYYEKEVSIKNNKIKLSIWDTAG